MNHEIDVDGLIELLARGATPDLIDVREPDEHVTGIIAGASCVPLGALADSAQVQACLEQRRPLVVYCASGMRSLRAVQQLRGLGHPDVRSLQGGIDAWRRSGQPLEDAATSAQRALSSMQVARYARQLRLPEVGVAGQRRLLDARVLCIGAGGLGSPASLYLAAAGVGTLGIVDDDVVEISNLQRQVLHDVARLGMPKVQSAAQTLRALDPSLDVRGIAARLDAGNAAELLTGYDLIIDGSDNLPTRYLVNDVAMRLGKPVVYGAVLRFEGQVSLFEGRPCYRCLFREPPPPELAPSCAEAGVLGVLPGIIGMLQATEAIKWLLGIGRSLAGRLLTFDALALQFNELQIEPDPACPSCAVQLADR